MTDVSTSSKICELSCRHTVLIIIYYSDHYELVMIVHYLFSAFACIQPSDSGKSAASGRPATNRWYYNSIKGQCETFQYHGSGGNANNFFTKDQCESYCKQCKELVKAAMPSVRLSLYFSL